MPQMGYDMQEGTVVRWLKQEGEPVSEGEAIAEIETDKAVVEFESYASGVLRKVLVLEGATVPVGEPIAVVDGVDEDVGEESPPPPAPESAEPPPQDDEDEHEGQEEEAEPASSSIPLPGAVEPEPEAAPPAPPREVRASPVARRLAEERGYDLSLIAGTGPGGRITKDDVLAHEPPAEEPASAAPVAEEAQDMPAVEAEEPAAETEQETPAATVAEEAPAVTAGEIEEPAVETDEAETPSADVEEPPVTEDDGRLPITRMRQQIARVTVRSKQEKPHFYVSCEIDMTRAMDLRAQINEALEGQGIRVSVNDLIIRACVDALKRYPKFNAFFEEGGIRTNDAINVGVAISLEEGLIVPAIMDCGEKSLAEIAQASKDLVERSNSGALHPQEYTGGTFAISNLGMYDVTSFVAIIQPPQTAVLAVGTVAKRPVVRGDQLAVAQTMNATLSADHRIVDGAEGAQFLVEVKRLLENPIGFFL